MIRLGVANMAELYEPVGADQLNYKLLVRARGDAAGLPGRLRQAARAADDRVLAQARLLTDSFAAKMRVPKLVCTVGAGMAALTLALAALDIFGMVSWSAAMRRKEIGIRIALGAPPQSVARIVLRQLAWPVGLGMDAGLTATAPLSQALIGL
jgi:ABC-type antimicrobial peptide transport system permease subunit